MRFGSGPLREESSKIGHYRRLRLWRSLSFESANLPMDFARLIGRPHNGQVVVFPVLGAERVISLVYTDNGPSNRAIEDIELLELATAQVGVAFENELLRRQIEGGTV